MNENQSLVPLYKNSARLMKILGVSVLLCVTLVKARQNSGIVQDGAGMFDNVLDAYCFDKVPEEKPALPTHYIILPETEKTQTVVDAVLAKGESDDAQTWLDKRVQKVRHDMGYSNRFSIRPDFDFYGNIGAETSLHRDRKNHIYYCNVSVAPQSLQQTVSDFSVELAHEIEHCYQNRDSGLKAAQKREVDADMAAARTYGPKATINLFDNLHKITGDDEKDITHGRWDVRIKRIKTSFPLAGP